MGQMRALCSVCQRVEFRHTCPRCEAVYCGLACYKDHNAACTEHFYKAQVAEELRSQKATGEERKRLERIVAELHNLGEPLDEGEEEEEDDDRLEELARKAEHDALSIDDLSEDELRRFHSSLKRGTLAQALEVWQPWWETAPVVELDSMDDGPTMCPPPHICCTNERRVNPAVVLSLLEVLCAYAHVLRAFNGDWGWDPLQAVGHLLHLGPTICTHRVFENAASCLQALTEAARSLPGGGFGAEMDVLIFTDVEVLLTRAGPDSSLQALQESRELLECASAELATRGGGGRARLQRGEKKLQFLASFASHHDNVLRPLALEVRTFRELREAELQQQGHRVRDGVVLPDR